MAILQIIILPKSGGKKIGNKRKQARNMWSEKHGKTCAQKNVETCGYGMFLTACFVRMFMTACLPLVQIEVDDLKP